jgi:hypothetical protein
VGEHARRQAVLNPLGTYASIKRILGRNYDEVYTELQQASFESRKSANGEVELWCPARWGDRHPPCASPAMHAIHAPSHIAL